VYIAYTPSFHDLCAITPRYSFNYTKHLTNKNTLLVPKMFYKTPVNIPHKKKLISVKEKPETYSATVYIRGGVNQANVDSQKFNRVIRKLTRA
jgi:hypothetical protein